MASSNWKTSKFESLEEFVLFVMKAARKFVWLLVLLALDTCTVRYGLCAELHEPPWDSLPIIGRAPG